MGFKVIKPHRRGGCRGAGPDCFYIREKSLVLSKEAARSFGDRAKFVTLLEGDDGLLYLSFSESQTENCVGQCRGLYQMRWLRQRYDIAKGLYHITGRQGAFYVTDLMLKPKERTPEEG